MLYRGSWASGFSREELVVNDALVEPAADGKRVADHRPLRLAVQAQHFAEVVQQAGQHEPVFMPIGPNRFGGLQQVLKLIELDIGIGVVDQRVEKVERFEDAHPPAVEAEIRVALLADEFERLMAVILPVELAHGVAGGVVVVPVVFLGLRAGLRINLLFDELFPRVQCILARSNLCSMGDSSLCLRSTECSERASMATFHYE